MHSFHHSRGRIFFEVLCALGISASCVGAWMQTGASAMLPAAFVAALYGLVHAFDMVRRGPAVATSAETAESLADQQGDLLQYLETSEPEPEIFEEAEAATALEESEPDAPSEPEDELENPAVTQEEGLAEQGSDEPEYTPVVPLFEPEPFVRKKRAAFGRKGG